MISLLKIGIPCLENVKLVNLVHRINQETPASFIYKTGFCDTFWIPLHPKTHN